MDNHYFGINDNFFLFGEFPNTVDGPHKVNSVNKAEQGQDVKAYKSNFKMTGDVSKVERYSQKNCSNRIQYGPEPKLRCV